MNAATTLQTSAGTLLDLETVIGLIKNDERLLLAGDEALLRQLPRGAWIGGTIPYFMVRAGGIASRDRLFCTRLPDMASVASIRLYDVGNLADVCVDAPANGFSVMIAPAFSQIHSLFARNAPGFEDMYLKPLLGWIAGMHLDDLGKAVPKVANGMTGEISEDHAVVLHAALPPEYFARIEIINPFTQGQGDALHFPDKGFSATTVLVNGQPQDFAAYITKKGIDTRLPLVADYSGAMVNVSIKGVDTAAGQVDFYAPVFEDLEYRFATPVTDYVGAFQAGLPAGDPAIAFSCNCILNWLYAELDGKSTGPMCGPVTFGEIAYQLLNQTLVYMTIEK